MSSGHWEVRLDVSDDEEDRFVQIGVAGPASDFDAAYEIAARWLGKTIRMVRAGLREHSGVMAVLPEADRYSDDTVIAGAAVQRWVDGHGFDGFYRVWWTP